MAGKRGRSKRFLEWILSTVVAEKGMQAGVKGTVGSDLENQGGRGESDVLYENWNIRGESKRILYTKGSKHKISNESTEEVLRIEQISLAIKVI